MASVTFASLKLKTKSDIKKIKYGDKEIEVKQYLPAEDKNSLLEITVQEADRGTVINPFALDCLFHVYLIFKYTNITFTDKQKEDLLGLYDILETNGVIEEVVNAIPAMEYNELRNNLLDMVEKYAIYRNSFKGALEQLQMFVPEQATDMKESLEGMDLQKMYNILSLAQNTGVDVETVKPELSVVK